jgi:hypothetical protein
MDHRCKNGGESVDQIEGKKILRPTEQLTASQLSPNILHVYCNMRPHHIVVFELQILKSIIALPIFIPSGRPICIIKINKNSADHA